MRKNVCNITYMIQKTYKTYKVYNPIINANIFFRTNNTKYLVPSETLINPPILSNLILNAFTLIKVSHEIP